LIFPLKMVDLSIAFCMFTSNYLERGLRAVSIQLGPLRKSLVDGINARNPLNRGWPGKYPSLVVNNSGIICELEKY
jgi:hypothetical protein